MSLTKKEIQHLAKLARLQIGREEESKFANDISSIIRYVNKLQEIRLSEIREDLLPVNYQDNSRGDSVIDTRDESQKQLISQAPEIQNNLVKTKRALL